MLGTFKHTGLALFVKAIV